MDYDTDSSTALTDMYELIAVVFVTISSLVLLSWSMLSIGIPTLTDKVEEPVTEAMYNEYAEFEYTGYQAYMIAFLSKNKTPYDSRHIMYSDTAGNYVMVDIDNSAVNNEFIVTYNKWLSENLRPMINDNQPKDQAIEDIRANWFTEDAYTLSYDGIYPNAVVTPSTEKYMYTEKDYFSSNAYKEGRRVLWQVKQN